MKGNEGRAEMPGTARQFGTVGTNSIIASEVYMNRINQRLGGLLSVFTRDLALTSALVAGTTSNLAADDGSPRTTAPEGMTAADIVDALISSRERLHAGMCRARWTWKTKTYHETANWTLYFDYDRGWSRIDRHLMNRPRDVIRITTPTEVLDYVPGPSGTITRLPPNAPALADGYAFDVRDTGLAALISIKGNAATWDNFLAMVKRGGDPVVGRESDGKLKLTWERTKEVDTRDGKYFERSGYSFWLDPNLQFSPVRAEFFSGASRDADSIPTKLLGIIEADWADRDGAPIPRRCAWTLPANGQSAELLFDWVSVNANIPGELFTPEGLNAPPGTQIINSKLGPSFIESIVGEEPPASVSSWSARNRQMLFVTGGTSALALAGIVLLSQRRRAAQQEEDLS